MGAGCEGSLQRLPVCARIPTLRLIGKVGQDGVGDCDSRRTARTRCRRDVEVTTGVRSLDATLAFEEGLEQRDGPIRRAYRSLSGTRLEVHMRGSRTHQSDRTKSVWPTAA